MQQRGFDAADEDDLIIPNSRLAIAMPTFDMQPFRCQWQMGAIPLLIMVLTRSKRTSG